MARTSFAERLKKLRLAFRYERVGLTVAELAKRAKLPRQAVHQFESGERLPNLTTARKLAKALGCTVDDLGEP